MILLGEGGAVTLLVPAFASAPGALLRARLNPGGAPASAVGYSAPEAVAAYEATPATDVYGLAALAYAALTGYAPLGQLNLKPHPQGVEGELARCVEASLNQLPALRPTMEPSPRRSRRRPSPRREPRSRRRTDRSRRGSGPPRRSRRSGRAPRRCRRC
jgi:hypothetical protein